MRKLLVAAVLMVVSVSLKAQDPHFSQFFASPLTLNLHSQVSLTDNGALR